LPDAAGRAPSSRSLAPSKITLGLRGRTVVLDSEFGPALRKRVER
jgi:hypothetical protein